MNQIKEFRFQRGLTQQQLADAVGVDQSAIVRWEQGKANPTVENLMTLSQVLGASTDALLGLGPPAN